MTASTLRLSHYVIKSLYRTLSWYYLNQGTPTSQRVLRLFELWKNLHATFVNISEEGWRALEDLARSLDEPISGGDRRWLFLYALETYLNVIMRATTLSKLGVSVNDASSFLNAVQVRRNIFEPNVFEWIFDALSCKYLPDNYKRDLNASLNVLLKIIYNLNLLYVSFDIFREVYQNILPREIRKSLGEFYTNEDLIANVLRAALLNPDSIKGLYTEWSRTHKEGKPGATVILDPACGSGSFLVNAIRLIFDSFGNKVPPDIIDFIEENIQGIDINPFAAEMAKLNIIITIASEMAKRGGIYTPKKVRVFWADTLAKVEVESKLYYEVLKIYVPALQRLITMSQGQAASIGVPLCPTSDPLQIFDAAYEYVVNGKSKNEFIKDATEQFYESIPSQYRDQVVPELAKLYDIILNIYNSGNSRIIDIIRGIVAIQSLVGKCKYVIGNPPWVRTRNLSSDIRSYLRSKYKWLAVNSSYNPQFTKTKIPFREQFDYSVAFVERGLEFLADNGILSYVITSKILRALYAGRMREDLEKNYTILELVDYSLYPVPLFQDAVNYPLVISIRKAPPPQNHKVWITVYNTGGDNQSFELEQSALPLYSGTRYPAQRSPWVLAPPEVVKLLKKIINKSVRLGDAYEVMMGVKTSLNEAYIGKIAGYNANKGTATLQLEDGTLVEVEEFLVHPVVRGEDLDPFSYSYSEYMIFPHDLSTFEPLWDSDQEKVLREFNLLGTKSEVTASGGVATYRVREEKLDAATRVRNAIHMLNGYGYRVVEEKPCTLDWCLRVEDQAGNTVLHIAVKTHGNREIEYQVTGLKIPNAPKATEHFTRYFEKLVKRDDYKVSLPPWAIFRVSREKFEEYRIAWQENTKYCEAAHLPGFITVKINGNSVEKLLVPIQTVYFIIEKDVFKALKLLIYINTDFARNLVKLWAWAARGGYYRHTSYAMGLLPVSQELLECKLWNFISGFLSSKADLNSVAKKIIEEYKDQLTEEILQITEINKEEFSTLVEYGKWLNELKAQPLTEPAEREEEAKEELEEE